MTNLNNRGVHKDLGHPLFRVFDWYSQTQRVCPPYFTNTLYTTQNLYIFTGGNPRRVPIYDRRKRYSERAGDVQRENDIRTHLMFQNRVRNCGNVGIEDDCLGFDYGQGLGDCPRQVCETGVRCRQRVRKLKEHPSAYALCIASIPSSVCAKLFPFNSR